MTKIYSRTKAQVPRVELLARVLPAAKPTGLVQLNVPLIQLSFFPLFGPKEVKTVETIMVANVAWIINIISDFI